MLTFLKIKNLALIANAEAEFAPGFNVFTGESGAGKSIFLNTISLLTGERADKSLIRHDAERCELSCVVTLDSQSNSNILDWLRQIGIEYDATQPEVHLRRVITRTQNRNYINDTSVTVPTLKELGSMLVDIHSAHDEQTLWSRSRQLDLIDRYGDTKSCRQRYEQLWLERQALIAERAECLGHIPSEAEAEALRNAIAELSQVAPVPGEDVELNNRYKMLDNAHEILQLTGGALQQITESENSLSDRLGNLYRDLENLSRFDETAQVSALTDSCALLQENLRDLASAIEEYAAKIDVDEETLQQLETRLSLLYTIKRRYGGSLERACQFWQNAEKQLALYEDLEQVKQQYQERETQLDSALRKAGHELSAARQQSAKVMAQKIQEKLLHLGFQYCRFSVEFSECEPTANGLDKVEMLFSGNAGNPEAPLRTIASSGEMARVMLAVKAVLADADTIPVLIFDEIDLNIGGETAIQVGKELSELACHRQLLCISHLPQVAACGTTHFAVSKHSDDANTTSKIVKLDEKARIAELKRMLGNTPGAELHAIELLANASRKNEVPAAYSTTLCNTLCNGMIST